MQFHLMLTFISALAVFLLLGTSSTTVAETLKNGGKRQLAQASTTIRLKPKPTKELAVPFHRQEHSLSCEIASLRSALLYKGVQVEESELMSKLPFDDTPKSKGVWGNPFKAFVGNIDGKMPSTGYGVYWDPIAKVGRHYRNTEEFSRGTLDKVLNEIDSDNPVIVWMHLGPGKVYYWKTKDGERIKAINYEHTKVVIGYSGPKAKPTGMYLIDPIYGRHYMSRSAFMTNWSKLDYSGVIVR